VGETAAIKMSNGEQRISHALTDRKVVLWFCGTFGFQRDEFSLNTHFPFSHLQRPVSQSNRNRSGKKNGKQKALAINKISKFLASQRT